MIQKPTLQAVLWDMICDLREGQIWVDDVLFYENGKFVVEGKQINLL